MKSFIALLFTVISFNAFAANDLKPLPKNDPLAGVSSAIRTNLRDNNISTGTTELSAGIYSVAQEDVTEKAAKAIFSSKYEQNVYEKLPKNTLLKIKISAFTNSVVSKMASAVLESNDYNPDNKEIRDGETRKLWAVLRKLPVSQDTLVVHVQATVPDNVDQKRSVQYFLLLNADGRAVDLFTVEGFM